MWQLSRHWCLCAAPTAGASIRWCALPTWACSIVAVVLVAVVASSNRCSQTLVGEFHNNLCAFFDNTAVVLLLSCPGCWRRAGRRMSASTLTAKAACVAAAAEQQQPAAAKARQPPAAAATAGRLLLLGLLTAVQRMNHLLGMSHSSRLSHTGVRMTHRLSQAARNLPQVPILIPVARKRQGGRTSQAVPAQRQQRRDAASAGRRVAAEGVRWVWILQQRQQQAWCRRMKRR